MSDIKERLNEKYQRGEISEEEYRRLLKDLEKLGMLHEEQNEKATGVYEKITVNGARTIEGGVNKNGTHVNGKFRSTKAFTTEQLYVNGKAEFEGKLEVKKNTKINGKIELKDDGIFIGPITITGKIESEGNLVFSSGGKVSGKVECNGEITTAEELKISGKLEAETLASTGTIVTSGPIHIKKGIIAEQFISMEGGGSAEYIKAKKVVIGEEYKYSTEKKKSPEQVENLKDLAEYLTFVISRAFSRHKTHEPKEFEIRSHIEGEEIQLSHVHVMGDIVGDRIILDENTKVDGVVKYRESAIIPENMEVETVQIS